MDALSSIPMGLGASLRAGGMLPPLAEPTQLMPTGPIEGIPSALPGVGPISPAKSFDSMLGNLVQEVNQKQVASAKNVRAMLAGEEIPLHRVMIGAEEASVSFQLMVEVRNKLLEAYQELMRMQI